MTPQHTVKFLSRRPSLLWRLSSAAVMGLTGIVCKSFLYGLNNVQTTGLDGFLQVLRERREGGRTRGLVTFSNHVSVLDDPLVWGVLPLWHGFNIRSHRWSLGAHDICFNNGLASLFFSLGQVLPVHRSKYSAHGGLDQPTMSQAIRMLSDPRLSPLDLGPSTFSTTGRDCFRAPAAYGENRSAWIHVFPEGCVHQHSNTSLRYFKWGVSRLLLESQPTPDVIPIFIEGTQNIMPENRRWPRFIPRVGADVVVTFGEPVDVEKVFGSKIRRWSSLRIPSNDKAVLSRSLETEVTQIRTEVAKLLRDQLVRLRRNLGYPDDDQSLEMAETWSRPKPSRSRFNNLVGGSFI